MTPFDAEVATCVRLTLGCVLDLDADDLVLCPEHQAMLENLSLADRVAEVMESTRLQREVATDEVELGVLLDVQSELLQFEEHLKTCDECRPDHLCALVMGLA